MNTTTPTSLRKELFRVIKAAARSIPTRIRYKKGDAVILSYQQYLALTQNRKLKRSKMKRSGKSLKPLLSGKILKPLNEKAEKELMHYMGL